MPPPHRSGAGGTRQRTKRVPILFIGIVILAGIMCLSIYSSSGSPRGGGVSGYLSFMSAPSFNNANSKHNSKGKSASLRKQQEGSPVDERRVAGGGDDLPAPTLPTAKKDDANVVVVPPPATGGGEHQHHQAKEDNNGVAEEGAAALSSSSASSLAPPLERPASWRTLPLYAENSHFKLDAATMPDEFMEHLQFMSSKIASNAKWASNGWARFDKKNLDRCGEEVEEDVPPLWDAAMMMGGADKAAGPVSGLLTREERQALVDGSYMAKAPGARISGLPECSLWRAISPKPFVPLKSRKKKGGNGDSSDGGDAVEAQQPSTSPEPLTDAQLERPYRKCCVEHAKLRDTAFFVFDHLEANNITYFLATGTALGAIRHNGTIIPWDTDVDLVIYPRDAMKAKAIFKSLSKGKDYTALVRRIDAAAAAAAAASGDESAAAVAGDVALAINNDDDVASDPKTLDPFIQRSLGRHYYSPDPQKKPMFWVHASKDGRPAKGPHIEIFYEAIYTSYPKDLLPLKRCNFYGRSVFCPNPKMFKNWFPSGWQSYGGGHYHGASRCTIFIKGVQVETDKC